jgi:hypothetical protein
MLAAFALTAWLVYLTVRRTRPAWALAAFVFVAWNPLLLFESAANGHNDTLMLAFTALALYLASRRHWAGVFPALAAAALIKYVTGLLGPLLLVWAWRSSRSAEERWRIVLGLILGLALTVVMYVPFWEGMHTFHALRGAAGDALNSPGWLFREGLRRAGVSDWTGQLWVSVTLTVLFIVAYVVALRMAWRAGGQALTPRPPRPMLGEGENTSITVDQSSLHSLLGAGEPRSTSVEQDSPLPVLGEGPGVRAVP